jgi:prepilin-type N-terminal cleavage/methylation domain-containing protein
MKSLKSFQQRGFSLVEMTVVVAIIGVLTGVSVKAITNIFGNSRTVAAKRNAQNIAGLYAEARAAGASFTGGAGGGVADAAAAASQLNTGVNGAGPFVSSRFQVPLDSAEQTRALTYLAYDATNDVLQYRSSTATP